MIDLLGPPIAALAAVLLFFCGLPWTIDRVAAARHRHRDEHLANFARQQHALRRASTGSAHAGPHPPRAADRGLSTPLGNRSASAARPGTP